MCPHPSRLKPFTPPESENTPESKSLKLTYSWRDGEQRTVVIPKKSLKLALGATVALIAAAFGIVAFGTYKSVVAVSTAESPAAPESKVHVETFTTQPVKVAAVPEVSAPPTEKPRSTQNVAPSETIHVELPTVELVAAKDDAEAARAEQPSIVNEGKSPVLVTLQPFGPPAPRQEFFAVYHAEFSPVPSNAFHFDSSQETNTDAATPPLAASSDVAEPSPPTPKSNVTKTKPLQTAVKIAPVALVGTPTRLDCSFEFAATKPGTTVRGGRFAAMALFMTESGTPVTLTSPSNVQVNDNGLPTAWQDAEEFSFRRRVLKTMTFMVPPMLVGRFTSVHLVVQHAGVQGVERLSFPVESSGAEVSALVDDEDEQDDEDDEAGEE